MPEQVKINHKKYFKEKIVKKLEEEIDNMLGFSKIEIELSEQKQKEFLRHVIDKQSVYAIGTMEELRQEYEYIEDNFSYVNEMIEKSKPYLDYMQKIFGYKTFITSGMWEYLIKETNSSIVDKADDEKFYNEFKNVIKRLFNLECSKIEEFFPKEAEKKDRKLMKSKFDKLIDASSITITQSNYKKFKAFNECWNPYALLMQLGLKVCPYCNRQYITPIYSAEGKIRADLDHFMPKKKYPYFSMSLYNLIPSCKGCNQSMKGGKEFSVDLKTPFEIVISEHFEFRADFINKSISTNLTGDESIQEYLKFFMLEELYNYHWNQAEELMIKKRIYTNEFVESLLKNYPELFHGEKKIMDMILGNYNNELGDEICSKFRSDIIKQLGFYKSKKRTSLEKRLRCLKSKMYSKNTEI